MPLLLAPTIGRASPAPTKMRRILPPPPRPSTAASMLQLVIHQPRQRGALPAVPFNPLLAGQRPEAGEVLAAGAHLKKLKSESLMFEAASNSGTQVLPGAPVENLQEGEYIEGERKANIIFRLCFAIATKKHPAPALSCTCRTHGRICGRAIPLQRIFSAGGRHGIWDRPGRRGELA